jgi:hypothetical protein
MHGTISRTVRMHVLRVLAWGGVLIVLLTITGHAPDSLAGWATHPPARCVVMTRAPRRRRRRVTDQEDSAWRKAWTVMRATVPHVVAQTVVLALMLRGTAAHGWFWGLLGVPVLNGCHLRVCEGIRFAHAPLSGGDCWFFDDVEKPTIPTRMGRVREPGSLTPCA